MSERPNPANQEHTTPSESPRRVERKGRWLILTRKIDQGVVIRIDNRQIGIVQVLGAARNRIKLGFSFDNDITIVRKELLERDRAAQEAANNSQSPQEPPGTPQ